MILRFWLPSIDDASTWDLAPRERLQVPQVAQTGMTAASYDKIVVHQDLHSSAGVLELLAAVDVGLHWVRGS